MVISFGEFASTSVMGGNAEAIAGVLRFTTTVAGRILPVKNARAAASRRFVSTSTRSPFSVSTVPRFAYIQSDCVAVSAPRLTVSSSFQAKLSSMADSDILT